MSMASTRGRKMQTFQALVADLNVSVYISYLRNLSPNFQFKQLLYDIGKRLPIFFLVVGNFWPEHSQKANKVPHITLPKGRESDFISK